MQIREPADGTDKTGTGCHASGVISFGDHMFTISLDTKEKSLHGILAVGGIAGLIEGLVQSGSLHSIFPGMLFTFIATLFGGFWGFFIKDLNRTMRGLKPYRGVHNDGMMMGAFLGSFTGVLFQLANTTNDANLLLGSMGGAFLGGMLGAIPDEFVTPILELLDRSDIRRLRPATDE